MELNYKKFNYYKVFLIEKNNSYLYSLTCDQYTVIKHIIFFTSCRAPDAAAEEVAEEAPGQLVAQPIQQVFVLFCNSNSDNRLHIDSKIAFHTYKSYDCIPNTFS